MLFESPNFRLHADDQVATLWMDFRGNPSQRWTRNLLAEFARVVACVAKHPSLDVLLVRSSKPGIFAGEFQVDELLDISVRSAAGVLAQRGQDVLQRLRDLPLTTIALIEGACTDAGLELALACQVRVVVDSPKTRLGFPGVRHGLLPCWGGSYRLTELVGRSRATDLLTSGHVVDAREAAILGLADRVFRVESAATELQTLVDQIQDRGYFQPAARWRRWLFKNLPTPSVTAPADVETLLQASKRSEGECAALERSVFGQRLFASETRRLLELHQLAQHNVRVYPEPMNPLAPQPHRIGIVGGGRLGCALAQRFVTQGCTVFLQEQDPACAERVRVALRHLGTACQVTAEWVGFDNAEFVVEAADEDTGLKRNLLVEIEKRVRQRVPIAVASTTIDIDAIQAEAKRPLRILGWHLPNVLTNNNIVELVSGKHTNSDTLATVLQWSRAWGFTPVRTADRAGRLVRFVWLNYLNEGVALVAEGLSPAELDQACRERGLARGPLEWCDDIGFDRLAELAAHMQFARGDRFARHLLFERLLPYGWIGRENSEGFYRYGRRRTVNELVRMVLWRDLDEDAVAHYIFDPAEALTTSVERLLLTLINAAAHCLPDEPDSDPATIDMALAFGMGCLPTEGGPLRYADRLGLPYVVDRLATFAERFGPRFHPCDELVRRAEAGEPFYSVTGERMPTPPVVRAA